MKAKIKIMKTRPEMTDEEIRSYMDFDKLLEMHKKAPVRLPFRYTKYFLLAGAVVSLGLLYWFFISDREASVTAEEMLKPENQNQQEQQENRLSVIDSVVDNNSKAILPETQQPPGKSETKPAIEKSSKPALAIEKPKKDSIQESKKPVIDLVYNQAAPVNGYPDLYEYFNRELKYPQEALKDSVQGEVIALFTINAKGQPENISVEHSLGTLFDKEVVRLITNMPAWKPATYNNKPVASKLSLPLTFQIKKVTSQK